MKGGAEARQGDLKSVRPPTHVMFVRHGRGPWEFLDPCIYRAFAP